MFVYSMFFPIFDSGRGQDMGGTFSQVYLQIVFAVKGRRNLIKPEWDEELHKYISGIVTNKGQKMLAINGVEDHIHMLIGFKISCYVPDLVREIKKSTNTWIKDKGFCKAGFEWQEGYGVFSYSYSELGKVIAYIKNQKEHHRKKSFNEEYKEFLTEFDIDFKEEYLF